MKKIYAFTVLVLLAILANGQITLYTDSFTSGSAGWQLDEDDVFDLWIVNNIYSCSVNTPDQGGGNYMHISDDLDEDYCAVGVFLESSGGSPAYATMTSGISTVGQTSVSITFDWLCAGQTGSILPSYGSIDYSVDSGNTWTNITQPIAKYSGQATWTTTSISSSQVPAMVGNPDFRIRFGFTNSGVGEDPAFAVDNIVISGNLATAAPPVSKETRLDVTLFPNPAKEELSVMSNSLPPNSTITIYNILGKKVLSFLKEDSGIKTVSIKNLPTGIYIIKAQSEKGEWIGKFMKE